MDVKSATYKGKPCRKCMNTLRYTSDKRCVHCKQEQNKKDWKRHIDNLNEMIESMTPEEFKEYMINKYRKGTIK
ncbi:hypothetical protein R4036_004601 [Salmonella enterica]|nr:hypothetical protein [Salmonella enterica]